MVHGHSFHHGKTAAALGQISDKKKKKEAEERIYRESKGERWQKNRYGTSHLPDFMRTKNPETRC